MRAYKNLAGLGYIILSEGRGPCPPPFGEGKNLDEFLAERLRGAGAFAVVGAGKPGEISCIY
ncbi:hypothetical protein D5270_08575 [Acutalibacter sp. 1XD8-36]|nr:hypothetical protein [Acutalibacter sp. 1XD8-36]